MFIKEVLRPTVRRHEPWVALSIRLACVMVLFMVSRFLFFSVNAPIFGEISTGEWLKIMAGGIRFDLVAVLYLNILYVVIVFTPFTRYKFVQSTLDVLFVFSNAVGLLANCIDTTYYPFNLKRMTWSVMKELEGFNNGADLLPSFLARYWEIWLVWIFFILALVLITRKVKSKTKPYSWHTHLDVTIAGCLLFIAGVRGGDLRFSTRPISFNNAGEYIKSPQNAALVFSTPFSIFKSIGEESLAHLNFYDTEQELTSLFNPVQKLQTHGDFKKMNVVVLVLESFTEEASGIVNKNSSTNHFTPFIDSLRRKSFYSEYSFSNGKKSIEALPAVWGSIPSFEDSYVVTKYASNKVNGLPLILKGEGYHTSFFHGAPNGSMGFNSLANLMGIEHYYGKNEFGDNSQFDGIWGIWDEPFLGFFADKLSTFPQPFFSTVFTLSSHDPFKVPEKYKDKLPNGPHPIFKTFSYSDQGLRKFFDKVKKEPWFNNTLFVITADHTSPSSVLPEFTNSIGKYRIPVFFYAPGLDIAGKSDRVFQQIDILPTTLQILEYGKPFVSFGKNLLDPKQPDFAVNRYETYQYVSGDYLLKLNGDYQSVGLFKYRTDLHLKENIIDKEKSTAQKIEREFRAFLQQFRNRMIDDKFTVELQ